MTKQPLIRSMRTVKRETLKLISGWVSRSNDPQMVSSAKMYFYTMFIVKYVSTKYTWNMVQLRRSTQNQKKQTKWCQVQIIVLNFQRKTYISNLNTPGVYFIPNKCSCQMATEVFNKVNKAEKSLVDYLGKRRLNI